MKRAILLLGVTLAAFPAFAKDKPPIFVESKPIKDKPAITLNPVKAYVLLRSDVSVPLYLMKVPTAEDQAAYDKLRAAALAESRHKYQRKLASYQHDKALADRTPNMRAPEPPVEPTDANFGLTPFGMMAGVGIGPINRFAKSEDSSVYLQELTPGSYRVYGLLFINPGVAATGSCFCLGSVKFEAKAGEVTDMGVISAPLAAVAAAGDSSRPFDLSGQSFFQPVPAGTALDPCLAAARVVPARYRPVGKLPNYLGLTVSRLPAMAGVMRYDRDRIVDLTGGENQPDAVPNTRR